jgi:phosphoribosylaminoimidazolecarboxamide formyltransferase/IMP cyclohydrolase
VRQLSSFVAVGVVWLKTAIVSCSDKNGLIELCKKIDHTFQIYSTGGTASFLREGGIDVRLVSELTDFPEILAGRIKTLHPRVLGGILARGEADSEDMIRHGLTRIDLVVVNLYPFMETTSRDHNLSEAIESIDIGGVTLIRAAAKNYSNVLIVTDPTDYGWIGDLLASGNIPSEEERLHLARKAFDYIARYDIAIARYFQSLEGDNSPNSVNI